MFRELFSANGIYARFMNFLWNMIAISVLWLICSIPIVTIGASSLAAYYAAAKCVRHHTGKVYAEFFSAFRKNFKQATVFTLVYLVVIALLVVDCVYIYSDASIPLAVLYLFYFLVLIAFANAMVLFPCMSRFYMSNFRLFRQSVAILPRNLLAVLGMLLILITQVLLVYVMPWAILVLPGLGFWLRTFVMEPILLRLSPKPDPDSEEAQKWYYQTTKTTENAD